MYGLGGFSITPTVVLRDQSFIKIQKIFDFTKFIGMFFHLFLMAKVKVLGIKKGDIASPSH